MGEGEKRGNPGVVWFFVTFASKLILCFVSRIPVFFLQKIGETRGRNAENGVWVHGFLWGIVRSHHARK